MVSRDRGSVSGLIVCLVMSMTAVVGISVEGGRIVQTYGELAVLSGSAARMGGQQIGGIQDGHLHIDKLRAITAMSDFLRLHHVSGEFTVGTTDVSVTLKREVHLPFLRVIGVSSRTVTVTRSVIVVKG